MRGSGKYILIDVVVLVVMRTVTSLRLEKEQKLLY